MPRKEQVVVKRYNAFTTGGLLQTYQRDAGKLAGQGYRVVSETPNQNMGMGFQKSVTYELSTPSPRQKSDDRPPEMPRAQGNQPTRECPDCAETILAAARVCRYCHRKFSFEEVAVELSARPVERRTITEIIRPWMEQVTMTMGRARTSDGARAEALATARKHVPTLVPLYERHRTVFRGVVVEVTHGPEAAMDALRKSPWTAHLVGSGASPLRIE